LCDNIPAHSFKKFGYGRLGRENLPPASSRVTSFYLLVSLTVNFHPSAQLSSGDFGTVGFGDFQNAKAIVDYLDFFKQIGQCPRSLFLLD